MRKLLLLAATPPATGFLVPTATASADLTPMAEPSANQLLAKTQSCKQISNGKYKTDSELGRTAPVCDANGAVWWRADMDIDCDGRHTARCNEQTDPWFQPDTAFPRSDGKPLIADQTHYVVVPSPSNTWRYTSSGIAGASACAVVYNNQVLYASEQLGGNHHRRIPRHPVHLHHLKSS
ncbi:glycoside hydrolase family 75 protein [Kibdelosporangium phytohabitans]|uniref:Secreted protein n=1 Tax=Kibdelosporangium phytohabitans TaxID=860235 RepID=A0A0N9HYF2_9PSEU|nr:glycoside hydrolase family 75 protein [Kibdelosporangium phytohabitans]ALG07299.1 hypothetical protein AOZ06_10530 [Kibdelosporangium phytohabitans]MBE1471836.1 hypothetical protein [Kibdelosporangium phytohabitans]